MRRIILLSSILLLSAVWAVAQYDPDTPSQSKTTSLQKTIVGCVDLDSNAGIGSYTLTDNGGTTYRLTGKSRDLKSHVGETVRVTGIVTPLVNEPGSMSEGTETRPTLSIVSIKRVSGVCSDTSY
jgi:hypothetical protein